MKAGSEKPSVAERGQRLVGPAATPRRGGDAERNADRDRDQHGEHQQREGRLRARWPIMCGHRLAAEDRGAEIAVHDLPQPGAKRTANGSSRPSEVRILSISLGRRGVAGDDLRRIARRQIEQAEHDQRHHAHHRARPSAGVGRRSRAFAAPRTGASLQDRAIQRAHALPARRMAVQDQTCRSSSSDDRGREDAGHLLAVGDRGSASRAGCRAAS